MWPSTNRELVGLLQQDADFRVALGRLVTRYRGPAVAYLAHKLRAAGLEHDADLVYSNLYTDLLEQPPKAERARPTWLERYDAGRRFRTYLRGVLRFYALRHIRARSGRGPGGDLLDDLPDALPGPEQAAEAEEQLFWTTWVETLLNNVLARTRDVLQARSGESSDDTGEPIGFRVFQLRYLDPTRPSLREIGQRLKLADRAPDANNRAQAACRRAERAFSRALREEIARGDVGRFREEVADLIERLEGGLPFLKKGK